MNDNRNIKTEAPRTEVRELTYEELEKVVGGALSAYTYSTAPTVLNVAISPIRTLR